MARGKGEDGSHTIKLRTLTTCVFDHVYLSFSIQNQGLEYNFDLTLVLVYLILMCLVFNILNFLYYGIIECYYQESFPQTLENRII